jgi:hypothetical protein
MLWEAHTAADELPAISSDAIEETAVRDRSGAAQPQQRGQAPAEGANAAEVDAPTERLPIYEAVLSQWFRPDETGGESDSISTGMPAAAATAPPAPVEPAVPVAEPKPSTNGSSTSPGALPTRVPGKAGAAYGFGTTPRTSGSTHAEPAPAPEPAPAGPSATEIAAAAHAGWETPADEGWQLAEALLAPVSETTGAGLPKRVPKAHLVPGSAAARPGNTQQSEAPPLPPRSADAVRGRMSSFQRGVRRGRHALIEAYSGGGSPLSDGSHDEEHE